MTYSFISVERDARLTIVTIDRPEVLNAANERLHRELADVWSVVDSDDTVAVSVITGAGRAFSAGANLKRMTGLLASGAATVSREGDSEFRFQHQMNQASAGLALAFHQITGAQLIVIFDHQNIHAGSLMR